LYKTPLTHSQQNTAIHRYTRQSFTQFTAEEMMIMLDREQNWPLVFFTVLGPASVGCLLGTLLLNVVMSPPLLTLTLLTVALVLAGLAFVASLAHLNKPARAYRAMKGFPHSNLSREVVSFTLYGLLLGLFWLVTLLDLAGLPRIPGFWIGVIAFLMGLVTIYATSNVYRIPARPSWQHWSTTLTYGCCALTLGVTTSIVLSLGEAGLASVDSTGLRLATLVVLIGIVGSSIAIWQRSEYLTTTSTDTKAAWEILHSEFKDQWHIRLGLGLGASFVLALISLMFPPVVILAWITLFIGEILDRKLFFICSVPLSFHGDERAKAHLPQPGNCVSAPPRLDIAGASRGKSA
jgi:DMSO reductase anchor subunit